MVYNCQLCINESGEGPQQSMQFPSLDQIEAHLAADHFGVLPYECEQCQFAKFPTEFAVIKHNEVDHGNRSYSFRCRITPEVKAKRRKVREFLSTLKMEDEHSSSIGLPSQSVPRQPQQQNFALFSRGGRTHQQQMTSSFNKFAASSSTVGHSVGQKDNLSTGRKLATSFINIKKEMNDFDEMSAEEKNAKDSTKQTNDQQKKDGECIDIDQESAIADESPTSLTEQIQVACLQKIRGEGNAVGATDGGGMLLPSAYGGTLEIREGAELTVAALLNAANAGNGNADDGLIEEVDGQQADVQEILKAAAAAVSQVGGSQQQHNDFGRRTDLGTNGGYSLRPNRFSPYALLHQGIAAHQYQIGRDSVASAPSFSIFNQGEMKREKVIDRIQCRKCKEMINAQGGCLNHHTNTRHMRLPMFQCTLCNKDFFEVSNTRIHKHMRLHHGGETKHLVSNYHKYSAALHAARDECFGRKEERIYAMRNPPSAGLTQQTMDFCPSSVNVGGATTFGRLKRTPITDPCDTVRAVLRNHHEHWPTKENRTIRTEMNSINSTLVQQQQRKTERNVETREINRNEEEEGIGTLKDEEGAEEETEKQRKSADGVYAEGMEMNDESEHQQQMDLFEQENEEEDEQMEEEEEDEEEEDEDGCEGDDGPVHPMLAMIDAAAKGDNGEDGRVVVHHQQQQKTTAVEQTKTSKNFVVSHESDVSSSHPHQSSSGSIVRVVVQQSQSRAVRQQPNGGGQFQKTHQKIKTVSYVGTDEKVPCKLCGEMVWNKITNRLNHVNVRHLQLPLHECAICHKSFASYSRSACYSHVQFAHKTEIESGQCSNVIEEHIIYRKDCYNTQLMEAARDYF